jgi:hypothetical protein
MSTTTLPPLRKPRHNDGRLMSEDEIWGLDGRELDLHAHHCIVDGDPVWLLPQNRSRVPHYSSDIAAAFTVDRPEWRWEMEDYNRGHFDVTVYMRHDSAPGKPFSTGCYEQTLDRKPTPADHAKARCIAALLLAAKIGE